jgi:hypothetical protein
MNEARKAVVRTGSATRIPAVEDEADLALLLAFNLEAEGYVVESVRDGDQADLRLREDPPDLVILDWTLRYSHSPDQPLDLALDVAASPCTSMFSSSSRRSSNGSNPGSPWRAMACSIETHSRTR